MNEAMDRLYKRAQLIGQLDAHLQTLREIHARLVRGEESVVGLADWISSHVRAGLDEAARGRQ